MLAIRHGDHGLIRHAADFWAKNGQVPLATVALTEAALCPTTGRAARQQMHDWATRVTTDKHETPPSSTRASAAPASTGCGRAAGTTAVRSHRLGPAEAWGRSHYLSH